MVEIGECVMNIIMGFKVVDVWLFFKYFGKSIVGVVVVETIIVIGYVNGKLIVWFFFGVYELYEVFFYVEMFVFLKNVLFFELRLSKFVAYGSGFVYLIKIDGGGFIGVIIVGCFGSIMYWFFL